MPSRRSVIKGSLLATLAALVPARAVGQVSTAAKVRVCKRNTIPIGGGKIVQSKKGALLITQPKKGIYRAFLARCTHEGCVIGPADQTKNAVQAGKVTCNCHGAQFSATDGKALRGPAVSTLKKFKVTLDKVYIYVS